MDFGTRLAGRFELLRKLGEGGSGVVYEALDVEAKARVALKTLQRMDPDALLRFKNEFRALQDVAHPNLVHLGELICAHGLWFFTMELVEGTDFFDYCRPVVGKLGGFGVRKLDSERLRHALLQLADALVAVHATGRIHCDVKPSNVRVTPQGNLVLLDFGLVTEASAGASQLRETVMGTPVYMAPEQARGEPPTPSVDWYGVGVVLYETLTGRPPVDGDPARVVVEKQHHVPLAPHELNPDVPLDLSTLCMRLLSIDPAMRPTGSEVLSMLLPERDSAPPSQSDVRAAVRFDDAPFIGRAAELEILRKQLAEVRDGHPRLVYISGESGVGKTTLAEHFAGRIAEEAQALVLRGRCYERESVPYKAFDGVVDDVAHHLLSFDDAHLKRLLPEHIRLLAQLFPVLERVHPIFDLREGPRTPQDPKAARTSAFAALRELFARLAAQGTLIVVIHDLQWADLDSLLLLEELLAHPEAPGCLFIVTGRPRSQLTPELQRALGPLLRGPYAYDLPLSGLDFAATTELVRALLHLRADEETAQRIAREAHGHPLFVMELVRHVEAGHKVDEHVRFDDAVRERLAQLDPTTRAMLEILAVASAPVTHPVLALALGLGVIDVDRRLSALRVARLVRNETRRRAECYHDRLRSSLLDNLDADTRRERHRALAHALSTVADADPEQVAYQWRCAGDPARAARHYAIAAEAAAKALAFERAARLFGEALSVRDAFSPERAHELQVGLADALSCAGFAGKAAEAYLEAAKSRSDAEAHRLERRATQLMLHSGRIQEGVALTDRILREAGLSRPGSPSKALMRLAWERVRLSTLDFDRIRVRKRPDPKRDEKLELLWAVAPSLAFVDLFAGSVLQSKYVRMALASGNPQHLARSLTIEALSRCTIDKGGQTRVEDILRRTREIADGSSDPYIRALVWMAHGYVHWASFRLQPAVAQLVQAERLFREACVDVAWELTNTRAGLLNALWNSGKLVQHDELAREWQRDARERGDRYAEAQLVAVGVGYQATLRSDDPDTADHLLQKSLEGWPDDFQLPQWGQYIGRQLVALYRGDGSAYALLRETWPRLTRSRLLSASYLALLSYTDAAWASLEAALQRKGSDRARLVTETRSYVDGLLATRRPLAHPLAKQIAAQLCVLKGRTDEAIAHLEDAYAVLREYRSVYQYPTAYLLGQIMGGDEGRSHVTRALTWANSEAIVDAPRWFTMFAPVLRV